MSQLSRTSSQRWPSESSYCMRGADVAPLRARQRQYGRIYCSFSNLSHQDVIGIEHITSTTNKLVTPERNTLAAKLPEKSESLRNWWWADRTGPTTVHRKRWKIATAGLATTRSGVDLMHRGTASQYCPSATERAMCSAQYTPTPCPSTRHLTF